MATVAFVFYLRARGTLPTGALFRSSNTKWYVLAGLANTMFLITYYVALSIAPVVLVLPVFQMSPLFVIVLSALFLRRLERITPYTVTASLIVVIGAILVSLQ